MHSSSASLHDDSGDNWNRNRQSTLCHSIYTDSSMWCLCDFDEQSFWAELMAQPELERHFRRRNQHKHSHFSPSQNLYLDTLEYLCDLDLVGNADFNNKRPLLASCLWDVHQSVSNVNTQYAIDDCSGNGVQGLHRLRASNQQHSLPCYCDQNRRIKQCFGKCFL